MLSPNYDLYLEITILKKILRYLTNFNRLYSLREDFYTNDLSQSMLSWVPRAQAQKRILEYQTQMALNLKNDKIPRSVSFYSIVLTELKTSPVCMQTKRLKRV